MSPRCCRANSIHLTGVCILYTTASIGWTFLEKNIETFSALSGNFHLYIFINLKINELCKRNNWVLVFLWVCWASMYVNNGYSKGNVFPFMIKYYFSHSTPTGKAYRWRRFKYIFPHVFFTAIVWPYIVNNSPIVIFPVSNRLWSWCISEANFINNENIDRLIYI